METKLFYKSQKDVAKKLNELIDNYWSDEIDEGSLICEIRRIGDNNRSKIFNGERFTGIVRQRCGKRRLEIVLRILQGKC